MDLIFQVWSGVSIQNLNFPSHNLKLQFQSLYAYLGKKVQLWVSNLIITKVASMDAFYKIAEYDIAGGSKECKEILKMKIE